VLGPFVTAYKAGATPSSSVVPPDGQLAVGAMWYRPILTTATCDSDFLGKPAGWENALYALNFAVLLSADTAGATINVMSDSTLIGSFGEKAGLNYGTVEGLVAGARSVKVIDETGVIITQGRSPNDVLAETDDVCNFNYIVVKVA
jgi:glucan endo-1,3-alpha-glucosidase